MSLDVYLTIPGQTHKMEARIFIREDGETKHLTRDEWDERFPGQEPVTIQEHETETRPPLTHFARNRQIVMNTELLIGCPREVERQTRGGTWYTIDYAVKLRRPCLVIFPDGSQKFLVVVANS